MGKIIEINSQNMDDYDLFCKKSTKNSPGYKAKAKWAKKRFEEGMKMHVLYVKQGNKETSRGFIEYIPGEFTWRGIIAPNYYVIHCLWVVGKEKGKGYGTKLVKKCIDDAKISGKSGVAVVVTNKTWMAKKPIFEKLDFKIIDEYPPHMELMVLKLDKNAPNPSFISESDKDFGVLPAPDKQGITLYYANQCPYMPRANTQLEELAEELSIPFKGYEVDTAENARACLHPYGICTIYYNGKFLAYQYDTKKNFMNLISKQK